MATSPNGIQTKPPASVPRAADDVGVLYALGQHACARTDGGNTSATSARGTRHAPCIRHPSRAREEAPEHKPAQLQPVVEIYGTDCLGFMPCDFAGNAQGWAFLSGRIAGTNAANEAMAL